VVVTGRRTRSIDPQWFETLFAEQGDPWNFETSAYEAAKYHRTLAALPRARYRTALEVGCATGVLTRQLAPRCDNLLAIDVSESALVQARARCADCPQVRFANRVLPGDAPAGPFDLVLLSEVIYYWDRADMARAATWLAGATASGGDLLLVHWTGDTDYPLGGDEAVAALADDLGDRVEVLLAERHERYRLDLWRRR
jgi:predicted TPR repeat methyltransferase